MADTKISLLTSAGALAGTEPLPIVQGGVTKKTTVQDVANLKATPNLQQVTNVGFTTTTKIASSNGAGSETILNNGNIDIATGDETVTIEATLVTTAYNAQLPNKLSSPQTFAMLSDITSGVTSVSAGTNISVTGTSTAPVINSLSDRYKTTSVTSNTITNGAKTFTVDANLAYIPLQEVLIVNSPSNHMHATVTSYSGTTLVVDVKTHTGSGTFIVWVINLDGVPIDAITGVGTANEIAYFTGGQVIASLPVATYPSLTELSYVKGVTSAIQTQINAKGTIFSTTTDGAVTVSSTSNVYTSGILIPANSFAVGNNVEVTVRGRKTGTAGNMTMRIYVNTTNDISGTPILVATNTTSAGNQTYIQFQRFLSIKSGSTEVFSNTGGSSIDSLPSNLGINGLSIDWTNNLYIVVSTQCVVATDSANARSSFIKIKN